MSAFTLSPIWRKAERSISGSLFPTLAAALDIPDDEAKRIPQVASVQPSRLKAGACRPRRRGQRQLDEAALLGGMVDSLRRLAVVARFGPEDIDRKSVV